MTTAKVFTSLLNHIPTRFLSSGNGMNISNRLVIYTAKNERFLVRIATLSHLDGMVDFLANVFIEKEPLAKAIGLRYDEAVDMLWYTARRCIPMGLSCIVTEENSDEVAAVRLLRLFLLRINLRRASRDDQRSHLEIRGISE